MTRFQSASSIATTTRVLAHYTALLMRGIANLHARSFDFDYEELDAISKIMPTAFDGGWGEG